jgi:hypothetical protein
MAKRNQKRMKMFILSIVIQNEDGTEKVNQRIELEYVPKVVWTSFTTLADSPQPSLIEH